jgi:hypothetical protein
MAGSSPDFDPAGFRRDIRAAMQMGMPADPTQRPTFRFHQAKTFVTADVGGMPFDWNEPPTPEDDEPARDPVQVLCAVETNSGAEETTAIGDFDADEAVLTFLEDEYAAVAGFDEVTLGGNTYVYDKELPPVGLYEVTVYRIKVNARDES